MIVELYRSSNRILWSRLLEKSISSFLKKSIKEVLQIEALLICLLVHVNSVWTSHFASIPTFTTVINIYCRLISIFRYQSLKLDTTRRISKNGIILNLIRTPWIEGSSPLNPFVFFTYFRRMTKHLFLIH